MTHRLRGALAIGLIGTFCTHAAADEGTPPAVSFRASAPDVRYEATRVDGVAQPPASCVAPCRLSLPPGRYAFWTPAGESSGTALQATVAGDAEVRGVIASHAALRTAGLLTLVGGLATGLTLSVLAIETKQRCSSSTGYPPGAPSCTPYSDVNVPLFLTGFGVAAVAAVVGGFMMRSRDGARLEVIPSVGPIRTESGATSNVEGLLVRARF